MKYGASLRAVTTSLPPRFLSCSVVNRGVLAFNAADVSKPCVIGIPDIDEIQSY